VATAQGRSLVACIKQQTCSAARFIAGRFSILVASYRKWTTHSLAIPPDQAHTSDNQGTAQSPRDINSRPAPNGDRCPYDFQGARHVCLKVISNSPADTRTAPSPTKRSIGLERPGCTTRPRHAVAHCLIPPMPAEATTKTR
jgi:hypothetical protein